MQNEAPANPIEAAAQSASQSVASSEDGSSGSSSSSANGENGGDQASGPDGTLDSLLGTEIFEDVNPVDQFMASISGIVSGFFDHLPKIIIALVILLLTFGMVRLLRFAIDRGMTAAGTRPALIRLGKNLIGIFAWIVGFAFAVTVIFPSITPANLIAGLGLTSVAIGFAFKDVFENFLAGVIILAREKMRINDIIECEGVFGRIEDISIRETHVRRLDGELTIVPNAFLFQNPLRIQTDQKLKRQELIVGVDYDASLPECREVLNGALETCETIDNSRPTEVKCVAFGGSSIDFKLLWWTDSEPKAQRHSYDEVAFAVKRALDGANIGIPFPQTTLSFRPEAQPVRLSTRREDRNDNEEGESREG